MLTNYQWRNVEPKLNNQLIKCLEGTFKFNFMTPVQWAVLPQFMKNKDVAVEASTGSGKTLAFLLPIFQIYLQNHKELNQKHLFALIIAPTRELAQQIYTVANILNENIQTKMSVQLCIGGNHQTLDIERIQQEGCNLMIGSPGKLTSIFGESIFKEICDLKHFYFFVLGEIYEADRLVEEEFRNDINQIMELLPKQRRTGLFSATLSQAKLGDLLTLGLRNPVKISIESEQNSSKKQQIAIPSTLNNYYVLHENRVEKFVYLVNFLIKNEKQVNKVIIFFNTCSSVEYYHKLLQNLPSLSGIKFTVMHGRMKQKKRQKIYSQFTEKKNTHEILIATDVIARGIDFRDVPLIIQFDPPQDPSFFIHRIGRTARQGSIGEAIILLEQNEIGFIKYLETKEIKINIKTEEKQLNSLSYDNIKEQIFKIILSDRDIVEKGKSAFISFIRCYKEHKNYQLQMIFPFNKLDIGNIANSFFLLRIPRIKEILGKKINFQQSDIDPFQIQFVDQNKEKQFLEKRNEKKTKKDEKLNLVQQHQKLNLTQQENNIKNNKSLRKKIKHANDFKDFEEMNLELNLVKKLKLGKINLKQFNEQMKQIDPIDLTELEFDKKVILKKK